MHSLLTVSSKAVFDSENVKGRSCEVKDKVSEFFATTSMWTCRDFSISLMFEPPRPIIDGMYCSFTRTLTRLSDKISTCALGSYLLKVSFILSSANFSIPTF